jgi:hypothetical protein
MEQEELEQIVSGLEELLDRLGYSAIVEQERRAAAVGRFVETTKEDRKRSRGRGESIPEVGDVRRIALAPAERLSMLIDLTEVAVGGTFSIEERVLDFVGANFSSEASRGEMPTFSPGSIDDFADGGRQWTLPGREALEGRRERVRDVLRDLQELRETAGVERDPVLLPEPESRFGDDQRELGWA